MNNGIFGATIDIKDNFYLYYTQDNRWREPVFFKRLFKWNWKKDAFEEFKIENDNKLNDISNIKIIKIKK
jgi:hypothetical protein